MGLYSSASAYAKDTWLPTYNYQLENEVGTPLALLGLSPETATGIEGRRAFVKIKVGDSLGQGNVDVGGDFPVPADTTADEATITLAQLAHTIEYDTHEMALLDSLDAAAAPIMAEKMVSAKEANQRDIVRQFFGDGTGILANVASGSGSALTLDALTTAQIDRDRYIWVDDANRMRYRVVDATSGASQAGPFTVTDITEATNVLTCSASVAAVTANGVLVRDGNWASGGVFRSLEFAGMKAMIADTNTYMGINRAAAGKGYWKSIVDSNAGVLRPVSDVLIHQILNKMARRASNGKQASAMTHLGFANFGVWTAYHQVMQPGLRYTIDEVPDIGWGSPLPMLGVPLYKEVHAPRNQINIIAKGKENIEFVSAKNKSGGFGTFLEAGGSIFHLVGASGGAQGFAARFQSIIYGFLGLKTERPRNHGRLDDLSEIAAA